MQFDSVPDKAWHDDVIFDQSSYPKAQDDKDGNIHTFIGDTDDSGNSNCKKWTQDRNDLSTHSKLLSTVSI